VFGGNSFKYQILFADKFVQKALLTGLGLPTPRLIGFVVRSGLRSTIADFLDLIDAAPNEFVLKFASGRGGEGVLGWDIVLTPDGPVIIEVNAAPGIDYGQYLYGGLVTDEMKWLLPKKTCCPGTRKQAFTPITPGRAKDAFSGREYFVVRACGPDRSECSLLSSRSDRRRNQSKIRSP